VVADPVGATVTDAPAVSSNRGKRRKEQ
jgi:hypothetical protein